MEPAERRLRRRELPPGFERLFAFGIDPVEGVCRRTGPTTGRALRDLDDYRNRVRQAMDRTLETAPLPEDGEGSFGQLLNIAIEHRLMHAETLAYMFHQLPFERKRAYVALRMFKGLLYARARAHSRGPQRWDCAAIPESFGWDNEFEAYSVDVPEFAIDKYKVTNGQFLEFLEDGGYHDRALWTAAGWEWKTAQGICTSGVLGAARRWVGISVDVR